MTYSVFKKKVRVISIQIFALLPALTSVGMGKDLAGPVPLRLFL